MALAEDLRILDLLHVWSRWRHVSKISLAGDDVEEGASCLYLFTPNTCAYEFHLYLSAFLFVDIWRFTLKSTLGFPSLPFLPLLAAHGLRSNFSFRDND